MIVTDPKPVNAWDNRAKQATVFGPCHYVSAGMYVYQEAKVRIKSNIQPQGLTDHDLNWIKVHMSLWDVPDCPLPLPAAELYDAASLIPFKEFEGKATHLTVTCPACIEKKNYKKPV